MNVLLDGDDARRLEELSLNASGAYASLLYDGWLLGYRRGRSKRLRCVNVLYPSALPLNAKIDYCVRFYRAAGLPAVFRLLPFSVPPGLDRFLEQQGWARFDRTLVLHAPSSEWGSCPSSPSVELVDAPTWVELTSPMLGLDSEEAASALERARNLPLPQLGAIIRLDGEIAACGLIKFTDDHAGLFAVNTAFAHRGRGLARAVVGTVLAEARRRQARVAYLQVTADNTAALALYRRFGFTTAYDYWYRARDGERC